jgi:hypothetical protein
VDLGSAAADLYGLPPDEFVAARTAAQRTARAGGDRDLAAQIRRLAKPTTVAWLVNQLVREHPDEIGPLLELGAGLREATATLSGEQLRTLSQQQHRVIHALVQQARSLGQAAGHPVTEATARGVEEALRAALADGALAEQLASGRLAGRLEHVGFAPVTGDAQPPPQPTANQARTRSHQDQLPPSDQAQQRRRAELRQAEQAVAEAEVASQQAAAAHRDAQTAADSAQAAVRELADVLQRLKDRLDRTVHDRLAAERAQRQAEAARDRAERTARQAVRRLEDARARRAQLAG